MLRRFIDEKPKMRDIFDNAIVCEDCNRKTDRGVAHKDGFQLRFWKCPSCGKQWFHPADLKDYDNFNKLKQREFAVKLRMVGNSWAISIPKEMINFQEAVEQAMASTMASHFAQMRQMSEKMNRMVRLCFEGPGKIGLFFGKNAEQDHDAQHNHESNRESTASNREHRDYQNQKSNGKKKVRVINKYGQVNA